MTYLIVDESTSQAALIDPVYDFMDAYVSLLERENLTLVYAIATPTTSRLVFHFGNRMAANTSCPTKPPVLA